MALFDAFSDKPAQNAALMANQGRLQGLDQYSTFAGQGRNALTGGYGDARTAVTGGYGAGREALTGAAGKADDIWSNTMTNYDNLYKGGAEAYGDVSGAHGVEGLQRGTDLFKNSGQYGVFGAANDAALQAIFRAHAAAGNPLSGNADVDAMKKSSDLAGGYWGQFQQGLLPYLQNYGSAIGTVGAGRAANAMALGTGLNANYTGEGTNLGNLYTGEAGALNTSYGNQGTAANSTFTDIGKNNAGAELNKYNTGTNALNAILGIGKLAAGAAGAGGLTGGLSSLFSGFGGSGSSISGGGGGYDPNTNMPLYSADGQRPLYA